MNLVSFALRRPISLLTMVVAVALMGFLALDRMARDIFPDLGVPTIYVAQPYGGLDPTQMEGFIVNYYEYHFLYITGIEHVESKSIQGVRSGCFATSPRTRYLTFASAIRPSSSRLASTASRSLAR
jgi:multidrug efflux pump subunit AcrB